MRLRWRSVWVLGALAAGLILRLWFFWRYASVSSDSLLYGDLAQNLLKHHVYGISTVRDGVATVRPTLIRLPGYPLFLAACFAVFGVGKFIPVMAVQILLDLWTCLLLGGLAARIFGERAGMAALWLGVLCPFMANYSAAPLTETPTNFCIALAFYALAEWFVDGQQTKWLWVLGAALAWAVLLRPEQGMLAAAIVPAVLWIGWQSGGGWWKRVRPAALVSLLTVLPLIPWSLRNVRTMHTFQPLAPRFANDPGEFNPAGFQRWYRTWAIDFASTDQVYWKYDGDTINIADLPNRAFDSTAQYAETEATLASYNITTSATPAIDTRFAALAAERIQADPVRYYLALPVARLVNMIFRPRLDNLPVALEWWKIGHYRSQTLFAAAYALLNLAYLGLAFYVWKRSGLWRGWQPAIWAMAATVLMRCALLLTVDNSEPRYTLEFYPVAIVLGSAAFTTTLARKR